MRRRVSKQELSSFVQLPQSYQIVLTCRDHVHELAPSMRTYANNGFQFYYFTVAATTTSTCLARDTQLVHFVECLTVYALQLILCTKLRFVSAAGDLKGTQLVCIPAP